MLVEFECEHAETEIRRRVDASNRPFFKRQCLRCGRTVGDAIAKKDVPVAVDNWDNDLELQWDRQETQARQQQREERVGELAARTTIWWQQYNAYLRSQEWQERRTRVLVRDNFVCQACLKNRANEVHHTTYAHVFNEPLFELVSVCPKCHTGITRMDREKRGAPAPN